MKGAIIGWVVFLFLGVVTSSWIFGEGSAQQAESDRLVQPQVGENAVGGKKDRNSFHSTNGKIIRREKLAVPSPYGKKVDLYRIRYLSDGAQVVGFLSKPRHVKGRIPAIIYNRGGIIETSKIRKITLKHIAKLASNGYVVAASQYRGVDGGGGLPDLAGKDVRDVLNLIPLVDGLPYVDRNQKVMLGFSRGGMMTYLAIKQGAEVRAAAVIGGVSDLTALYEQSGDVFRNPLNKLVGDPLLDAEEYKERSAVEWPGKLKVPLLLMHGLNDRTVRPEHSERLAEALSKLGYEHRLVLVPGGSHYLYSHPKKRDEEILRWFDRYLAESS
ncbi:alpha/beta hydrolase family protein [Melghirimyces profundicolus]|uniref:alpha/beta hydrolase family protein n=1 Tax=Melghirimyces profundicolus TaxID=1242148 RepID=UPI0014737582|nr:prolyl oligopeptidase family serine peptidase [Melghirimyces profundicolus]